MSVIYLLVGLGILLVGAAVWAFVWSVRRGDMDDLDTPAVRVLFDEDPVSRQGPVAAPAPTAPASRRNTP